MIYDWPSTLYAKGVAFNQRGMSVSGPVSMTGRIQTSSIDAGYWIATIPLAVLNTPTQVRAFRQLRALLEGGTHHIRVPVFDDGQAPWAYSGDTQITALSDVTFSDGALFADGAEFYQSPITVELSQDASLGDMSITVDVTFADEVIGGEYFSLGDHLYVIKQILADGADDSPPTTIQTWSIWPRLREDWPTGTDLNFARPVCRMKLVEESAMDLTLGLLWHGEPVVAFVEVPEDEEA